MPIPAAGDVLTFEDLLPFAPEIDEGKAQAMVEDALALAALAAPCLDDSDLTSGQIGALRAILRGAVVRWHEAGSGAMQSQQVGPFGQTLDTRQPRRGMFWPSEIQQLQNICRDTTSGGIFSIDTVSASTAHADICALAFGAVYCSCGADLTLSGPLYEVETL